MIASIRGALTDTKDRAARARLLAAAVEILLAADDIDAARDAAAELSEIARAIGAGLLHSASAQADGAVCLAAAEIPAASALLRQALEGWRDLAVPYEEALTRLLLAEVYEHRGDHDGRRLELDAARRLFEELKAVPCVARLAEEADEGARHNNGPLSEREGQVLRLLAAGETNRDIAGELFISEKTVARHVSNIFDKLGVSSRAAATAWAYQQHLV